MNKPILVAFSLMLVLHGSVFAAPIRSVSDLNVYLEQNRDNASSPLKLLPEAARQRFLRSLKFNEQRLAGFNTAELAEHLTHAQIDQLLSLFDAQRLTSLVGGINEGTSTQRATASAPEVATPISERFDRFVQEMEAIGGSDATKAESARRIEAAYAAFRQDAGASPILGSADLALLFRGAEMAAGSTQDHVYVEQMLAYEKLLEARGLMSARLAADQSLGHAQFLFFC
jgi:hypothetical protein